MRALWLDFQRPEPGRRRAGNALLAVGVLLGAGLLADYVNVVGETDQVEQQVLRLRREAEPARRAAAVEGAPTARGGQRQAADDTSSSQPGHEALQWDALFAALEAAADDSMTLLTLNTGGSEIQIGGEARNIDAAMDYVKRLQAATALGNPHLTQSEVVQEHPQHPVRFALAASWREGGR